MKKCGNVAKSKSKRILGTILEKKHIFFLQKLKCPTCGRILGGKATTKKNGTTYYYYQCNKCRNNIKEVDVERQLATLLSDLFEYDFTVNEFFLPLIKNKLNNPKLELEKELTIQQLKQDRIKKAYINGTFTLTEYEEESKIIEDNINELNRMILENNQLENLSFTKEDILIKRDMDFINRIKLPHLYNKLEMKWHELDRENKQKITMNYIEDIELSQIDKEIILETVNFRNTFYKDFKELFSDGFIDWKIPMVDINGLGFVRYSEYMPAEKIEQHILRLRECYEVFYYKGTFDIKTKLLNMKKYDNTEVVRIFSLERPPYNEDKLELDMGVISVRKNSETYVKNEEKLFTMIPE